MPGFELEQVDEGGQPIDLPHGDTVIGRGSFLGVSDKRVSRNHGILENTDGGLRLKPTHVNPCFVQASLDATPQPLEKERWHWLKDGSIFSLLPGKYIYRVRAVDQERTPRNSQGFEEEGKKDDEKEEVMETEQDSRSSRSCEETLAYTPQAKSTPSFTYESAVRDETHAEDPAAWTQVGVELLSSCKSDIPDPVTPRKKRVLPAWMMDVAPAALSTTPAKAAKRAPAHTARKTQRSVGPKRPRTRLPSSSNEDEEKEVDEEEGCSTAPRKRARRLQSDTEEVQDQAPVPKSRQERVTKDEDASTATAASAAPAASSADGKEKEKESKRAENSQRSKAGGSTLRPESATNSQAEVQQKTKVQRRTSCPYGSSCYRKNPLHFQECSHPGDDDYEEEQSNEDDKDDERAECPYGTDCYRKNPLHKKEYKHTKPPAAPGNDDGDEDEDEDQYENSFINDDSEEEDVDEDSEYVPESEDSEKEDVRRLQKEAKAFLRRKK